MESPGALRRLRLRCVSLGPREDGRDYGLLPRFRSLRLPDAASAALRDFALALFDWGLKPAPPFSILYPLDDNHHLLARVAYIRRGSRGPVVRANGLLLDHSALELMDWKAHRLLRHVHPAEAAEWPQLEITVPAEPGADAAVPDMVEPARDLLVEKILMVEITSDSAPEAVVAGVIEEAPRDLGEPVRAWSTTSTLKPIGRFEPARFALLAFPVRAETPQAPSAWRLGPFGLSPPAQRREYPLLRYWYALFKAAKVAGDWESRFPTAFAACRKAIFPKHRLNEDPQRVLIDEMLQAIRPVSADARQFWALAEHWAGSTGRLEGADRSAVAVAVGALFRRLIETQSNTRRKAALLNGYVRRVEPKLGAGPALLPVALANEHHLIAYLEPGVIEILVPRGLGTAYASDLAAAVETGRIEGDRLIAVVRSIRSVVEQGSNEQSAAAALAALNRASAPAKEPVPALVDAALALGETLLCRDDSYDWRQAVPALVNGWRAANQLGVDNETIARLRASLRCLWRTRRDGRRCTVVGARLRIRTAAE